MQKRLRNNLTFPPNLQQSYIEAMTGLFLASSQIEGLTMNANEVVKMVRPEIQRMARMLKMLKEGTFKSGDSFGIIKSGCGMIAAVIGTHDGSEFVPPVAKVKDAVDTGTPDTIAQATEGSTPHNRRQRREVSAAP